MAVFVDYNSDMSWKRKMYDHQWSFKITRPFIIYIDWAINKYCLNVECQADQNNIPKKNHCMVNMRAIVWLSSHVCIYAMNFIFVLKIWAYKSLQIVGVYDSLLNRFKIEVCPIVFHVNRQLNFSVLKQSTGLKHRLISCVTVKLA